MLKLVIVNLIIILIIVLMLLLLKRIIKEERGVKILFIVAPILTILCHYSSLLYHLFDSSNGTPFNYLESNPNLVLPIYPCNVVMWCALIFGVTKKNTKFSSFLADFIFLFGVVAGLVGLFMNIDFIRKPTFKDYDIVKGIFSHGFMLFNVLIIPVFGFYKLDLKSNMIHVLISILMMFIIGLYCNLLISVIGSSDYAYNVNSMFILHSPIDGVKFLTYPFIAGFALILYFVTFHILELIKYEKGNRWFNRIKK